jgi:hypothetical protein
MFRFQLSLLWLMCTVFHSVITPSAAVTSNSDLRFSRSAGEAQGRRPQGHGKRLRLSMYKGETPMIARREEDSGVAGAEKP